jgi:hypothetical protein
MAGVMVAGGLAETKSEDIVIETIRAAAATAAATAAHAQAAGRRQLQSSSALEVDFSVLAGSAQSSQLTAAASSVAQSGSTPITLVVGGSNVAVAPASAMAAPTAVTTANIDCAWEWSECRMTCSRDFVRTVAPSGGGLPCPADDAAPPCMPHEGECDTDSKMAAFRVGQPIRSLFAAGKEKFGGGVVCTKAPVGSRMRYNCKTEHDEL